MIWIPVPSLELVSHTLNEIEDEEATKERKELFSIDPQKVLLSCDQ